MMKQSHQKELQLFKILVFMRFKIRKLKNITINKNINQIKVRQSKKTFKPLIMMIIKSSNAQIKHQIKIKSKKKTQK